MWNEILEEALNLLLLTLKEKGVETTKILIDSVLLMLVPQYGVSDASLGFYNTVGRKLSINNIHRVDSSPCILNLVKVIDGIKQLIAILVEHVDDFMVVVADFFLVEIKKILKDNFNITEFEIVGDVEITFTGREYRRVVDEEGDRILISNNRKVRELQLFQCDEAQRGLAIIPDKTLSSDEVTRLRSLRGETSYISHSSPDIGFLQRVNSKGNDVNKCAKQACKINEIPRQLQAYPSELAIWLDLNLEKSELVYILLTDGSFQSYPEQWSASPNPTPEVKFENDELNALPLSVWCLLATTMDEITRAIETDADLKTTMLDWGSLDSSAPTKSSMGAEIISYDVGIQSSEITKFKFDKISAMIKNGEKLLDLIDSESTITRVLSRSVKSPPEEQVFKALVRARHSHKILARDLVRISDVLNKIDIMSKRFPPCNRKYVDFRRMMSGFFKWAIKGDKKSKAGCLGTLRQNIKE